MLDMSIKMITKPWCERCGRGFRTAQALAGHNRFVHGEPGQVRLSTRRYVLDEDIPGLFMDLLIASFRVVLRKTEGELPAGGKMIRDAFVTVLAFVERDRDRILAEVRAKFRP